MRRRNPPSALNGLAYDLGAPIPGDPAHVVIDTGYGLHRIGRGETADWHDEFDLGSGGDFELHVWDGRERLATLNGRIVDGSSACEILDELLVSPLDECLDDMSDSILVIDYVRVRDDVRGRNYSHKLLDAAVYAFARRGWWVFADCFSQVIYRALRQVLPAPKAALPAEDFARADEPMWAPSDAAILSNLDPVPRESASSYKGHGYRLANKRHVGVLWKV